MARGAGRVSDLVAIGWLDDLAARTSHLSLMTSDPYGTADPRTVEPAGGVYARAQTGWLRSGRLLRNSVLLSWVGLAPNTVITHISGWDAAFNGNMLFSTPIEPLTYSDSSTGGLIINEQEFFVGLDL